MKKFEKKTQIQRKLKSEKFEENLNLKKTQI